MLFKIVVLLAALGSAHGFAVMPAARSTPMRSSVSPKMQFGFFGGGGGAKEEKTVRELLSFFSMTDYWLLSSLAWRKSHTIPCISRSQGSGMNARDADFARRQERLAGRQAQGAAQEKGAVECTFPQKGNKVVMAKQGEPLGKVIGRAGLKVKFDCKVTN